MADATTTGSSNQAQIATEVVAETAIAANLPRMVMNSLIHYDRSLDGAKTNTKKYPVLSDHGAASGGTEGVEVATPTVELNQESALTASPTEGVLDRADISEDLVMQALGVPYEQLRSFIENGSVDQWISLLGFYVQQMVPRGMQKMEEDALALIQSVTNTVGTSTQVAKVLDFLSAIFQHRKQEPTRPVREARFLATTSVYEEVTKDALATDGGLGGAIWNQQADFSLANMPPEQIEGQGFIGTFLRYPCHEISDSIAPYSGTVLYSAFGNWGIPGRAATEMALAGRCGAIELVERTPLDFKIQPWPASRGIRIFMNARYVYKLVKNTALTGITTLKPS